MTDDEKAALAVPDVPLNASLQKSLKEIEQEETPERLLALARELQLLLRAGGV